MLPEDVLCQNKWKRKPTRRSKVITNCMSLPFLVCERSHVSLDYWPPTLFHSGKLVHLPSPPPPLAPFCQDQTVTYRPRHAATHDPDIRYRSIDGAGGVAAEGEDPNFCRRKKREIIAWASRGLLPDYRQIAGAIAVRTSGPFPNFVAFSFSRGLFLLSPVVLWVGSSNKLDKKTEKGVNLYVCRRRMIMMPLKKAIFRSKEWKTSGIC